MKKLITAALLASLFMSCSTPPEDVNTNSGSGTTPENPSDSNYSFETAERITLGSTVKGNLFNSNDIDSYVFDIPHNALLRVELLMVSNEARHSYLTLCDSGERDPHTIALVDSAIYFPIAKPGTYYLCSSGFLVAGHGPVGAGDFEFIVSIDTIDTHEFNDNIDNATPIQRNTVYQSKLLPTSTDIDYFTFTIDKPQAVKLDIDNISSRYRLTTGIFDEEGVSVNSYSHGDTQDDTLNIITHLDKAGTYLIGFSATDNSGDSDKPFSFSINDYMIDENEFNDNLKNATPIHSFIHSHLVQKVIWQ